MTIVFFCLIHPYILKLNFPNFKFDHDEKFSNFLIRIIFLLYVTSWAFLANIVWLWLLSALSLASLT